MVLSFFGERPILLNAAMLGILFASFFWPSTLDVRELTLNSQKQYSTGRFPTILHPNGKQRRKKKRKNFTSWSDQHVSLKDSLRYIRRNRDELIARVKKDGALLLRGFGVATPNDFNEVIEAFGIPNFSYDDSLSNAFRIMKAPRVFTANEAPPNNTIFLHVSVETVSLLWNGVHYLLLLFNYYLLLLFIVVLIIIRFLLIFFLCQHELIMIFYYVADHLFSF